MKLSVVIPAFNEVSTIETLVERVHAVPLDKEIILIDDGSTDGTRQVIEKLSRCQENIKAFYHAKNRGKGAALRTGFQAVTGDIVIIQDADLEYNPAEYPRLLQPLLDGRADVVFGSRFLGKPHRVLFFWHYLGNKILTLLSNAITNINLTDMETGYKAFRADLLESLVFKSNRFGFEPEFTIKVARQGCRIYEVPISYSGRTYAEGKKISWHDGFKAIFTLIRFWLFD
ncbi:MAG: glycosyltransferase family 2 protein [Calditrichaeota bacterium]|nr:MAG: glycosyltransferase family 2 protein [Calditrichota bacterium]